MSKLIFEKSVAGSTSFRLPPSEVPEGLALPASMLCTEGPALPEISEVETVRHFVELSKKAYGVDTGFYPLGSCTMKYNPKINEWAARLPGLASIHPLQPVDTVQGALEIMHHLERILCEVTGMDQFSLQPAAGAHGELAGILMMKAYFAKHGETQRTVMLVPDSAHGTNPATANMAGYKVVQIKSDARGRVDVPSLRAAMNEQVAGIMLTNPNTLGLFEDEVAEIAHIVHSGGGLLYYDGANANGMVGVARPGDMGFDVAHLNLHKTFGTPHGGGGPGSGPVGVKARLAEFLPVPIVRQGSDGYYLECNRPHSIGQMLAFYGNFGVLVRAYAYALALGGPGLREAGENAVLNANYLRHKLRGVYDIPFDTLCKHEFVATPGKLKSECGVSTIDIAKRLLDYGYHPPTVYFPLIVPEAMLIEPTETETKERLDVFVEVMVIIAKEARENAEMLKKAPSLTPVRRVDEVGAARKPILRYKAEGL